MSVLKIVAVVLMAGTSVALFWAIRPVSFQRWLEQPQRVNPWKLIGLCGLWQISVALVLVTLPGTDVATLIGPFAVGAAFLAAAAVMRKVSPRR